MTPHLDAALDVVRRPDAVTPDRIERRWRYWQHGTGPTQWLFVVVDWDRPRPEIVTAFGRREVRL